MERSGLVHQSDDAAETTQCGQHAVRLPDEDMVIATGKHPREYGAGLRPCPVCYPEEVGT